MSSIRTRLRLLVVALAALAGLAVVTPAQAAAPFCGITWGSLAKTTGSFTDADLVHGVRAGRHACYDRLVVDLLGEDTGFSSYDVRYVRAVTADGSGTVVPLRGGAFLQVTVGAPSYDGDGNPTFAPANRREVVAVSGFRTFRQVAWAGSFEGRTDFGLGVRARLPFRVFVLPGVPQSDFGPRLVIDVAHAW